MIVGENKEVVGLMVDPKAADSLGPKAADSLCLIQRRAAKTQPHG